MVTDVMELLLEASDTLPPPATTTCYTPATNTTASSTSTARKSCTLPRRKLSKNLIKNQRLAIVHDLMHHKISSPKGLTLVARRALKEAAETYNILQRTFSGVWDHYKKMMDP